MSFFIQDPKTGERSVSLTILILATTCMTVAVGLDLAGISKGTGMASEWFLGASALYFGRKFTNKGASLESSEKDAK